MTGLGGAGFPSLAACHADFMFFLRKSAPEIGISACDAHPQESERFGYNRGICPKDTSIHVYSIFKRDRSYRPLAFKHVVHPSAISAELPKPTSALVQGSSFSYPVAAIQWV